MNTRHKSRLAKLEAQPQPCAVEIVVVEDEEFYGNDAHRMTREAERGTAGADLSAATVVGWYGDGVAKEEAHDGQEPNPQA